MPLPMVDTKVVPMVPTKAEVCGLGQFSSETDVAVISASYAAANVQAKQTILMRLHDSRDVNTRVAGLMLKLAETSAGWYGETATSKAHLLQRMEPWVNELTTLASTSSYPELYAQAVQFCDFMGDFAACGRVNARQWARLDPHNMAPWLKLLERAQNTNDQSGIEQALHQMSQATSVNSYRGLVLRELLANSNSMGMDMQAAAAVQLASAAQLFNLPAYRSVVVACSKPFVHDPNRRQLCERIAIGLVAIGDTEVDVRIGAIVGGNVGWSAERVATIRTEAHALAMFDHSPDTAAVGLDDTGEFGCIAVQKTQQRLMAVAQHGEMGAARARARDSGLSVQAITQAHLVREAQNRPGGALARPAP